MDLEKGEQLLNLIEKSREELNYENYHIKNADWRIKTHHLTDGMWYKVREEHTAKLQEVNSRLEKLHQDFYSMKPSLPSKDWHYLLAELGTILAKTEDIEHVANSLYDEYDLNRALNEVEQTINNKWNELEIAKEKGDEDSMILVNAQIKYHVEDMSLHHWGEQRLEKMYQNKGKGRK